jgi:hypothetical protein
LRTACLLLSLFLLVGCTDREAQLTPAPSSAKDAPKEKTPVQGAVLQGQGIDEDGDGKIDLWRHVDPNTGETVEARDTDGDGVADEIGGVETRKEPPPGMSTGEQPLEALPGPPPPAKEAGGE